MVPTSPARPSPAVLGPFYRQLVLMRRCTPDTASGSVQQPPRQLLVCLLGSFKHWVAGLATATDGISTRRPIPCARLLRNCHLPRLMAFRYGARHPNCMVTLWLAWAELWGECGCTGASASSAHSLGRGIPMAAWRSRR